MGECTFLPHQIFEALLAMLASLLATLLHPQLVRRTLSFIAVLDLQRDTLGCKNQISVVDTSWTNSC